MQFQLLLIVITQYLTLNTLTVQRTVIFLPYNSFSERIYRLTYSALFCFLSVDEIHSHPDVFLDEGPAPGGAAFTSCEDEAEKAMKQEVDDDSKPSGCRENKLSLTIANSECVGRLTLLINLNPLHTHSELLCFIMPDIHCEI